MSTFLALVERLSERIGHHQVPLRPDASEIDELLAPDGVHHELITTCVRSIYRANRCGHLGAGIDPASTFSALGGIRGELLRSARTDVHQIELLDALGAEIAEFFDEHAGPAWHSRETGAAPARNPSAHVVRLARVLPG